MLQKPSGWVEKPGNPNFLVPSQRAERAEMGLGEFLSESTPLCGVDSDRRKSDSQSLRAERAEIGNGVKRESDSPSQRAKRAGMEEEEEDYFPPACEKKPKKDYEEPAVRVLQKALRPFYSFVGMVEAASGTRIKYRWVEGLSHEDRMIPLNYGATNAQEFRQLNEHLGEEILTLLEPRKGLIGAGAGNNPLEQSDLVPEWIGCLVDDPIFQFILGSADYGSMEMAANELGFPLKDLIWSPDVSWRFAEFVGRKFFKPNQNVFAAGINGGQIQYRVASGFKTTQQADSKWLMGARIWFRQAYYEDNNVPAPTAQELRALVLDYNQQMASLRTYREDVERMREANDADLPAAELELRAAERLTEAARQKYLRAERLSLCHQQRILTHPERKRY